MGVHIKDQKYDCFKAFTIFIIENEVTSADSLCNSTHLNVCKETLFVYECRNDTL